MKMFVDAPDKKKPEVKKPTKKKKAVTKDQPKDTNKADEAKWFADSIYS